MAYYINQPTTNNNYFNYTLSNNQFINKQNQLQKAPQLQTLSQIGQTPQPPQTIQQIQQQPQAQIPQIYYQQNQNQLAFSQLLNNKQYYNNKNQNIKQNLNTQANKLQYNFPLSNKKMLVLDLDETLVHASFDPPTMRNADFVFNATIDQVPRTIHVLIRPYTEQFLAEIANYYDVVVFTSSIPEYAGYVIDKIDKYHVVKGRLFRADCDLNKNGLHLKDLKKLGKNLKDIIIIDNCPISYELNEDNGIPIEAWYSDLEDNELLKLIPFLKYLSKVDDVRPILKQVVNRSSDSLDYNIIKKLMMKGSINSNLTVNSNRVHNMAKMNSQRNLMFIDKNFNANKILNQKKGYGIQTAGINNINNEQYYTAQNNNFYNNNMNLTSNNYIYYNNNANIGNNVANLKPYDINIQNNLLNQQNKYIAVPQQKSAKRYNRNIRSITPIPRSRQNKDIGFSSLGNDYTSNYVNYGNIDQYSANKPEYVQQGYGYVTNNNNYVNVGVNQNYYVPSAAAQQGTAISYQYI